MKTLRSFKMKSNGVHAPWGDLAKPAKGMIDEAGIEFVINRDDFKNPAAFDAIFPEAEVTCFATCSRIISRWGCAVNNRWVFSGDAATIERFRAAWIAKCDAKGCDHHTTLSQANAQQWMSVVMISFLKPESLPDVPAELLNS